MVSKPTGKESPTCEDYKSREAESKDFRFRRLALSFFSSPTQQGLSTVVSMALPLLMRVIAGHSDFGNDMIVPRVHLLCLDHHEFSLKNILISLPLRPHF